MAATMAPRKSRTTQGKPALATGAASKGIGTKRIIVILTCPPSKHITAYEEADGVFFFEQSARLEEGTDAYRVAKELFMRENILKVDIWKVMEDAPKGTIVIACRTAAGSGKGVLVNHPKAQVLNAWPRLDETQNKVWRDEAHKAAFAWAQSLMCE